MLLGQRREFPARGPRVLSPGLGFGLQGTKLLPVQSWVTDHLHVSTDSSLSSCRQETTAGDFPAGVYVVKPPQPRDCTQIMC